MNDEVALRILGLSGAADGAAVRRAFASQLRDLRVARAAAQDPARVARLDRAMAATLAARAQLLKMDTGVHAATEAPSLLRFDVPRPTLVALGLGVLLLLVGVLLPDGSSTPAVSSSAGAPAGQAVETIVEKTPEIAAESAAESAAEKPARAWLDPWRQALARAWQAEPSARLPARTALPDGIAPPPAPWRASAQAHGAFALMDGRGAWLLAIPRRDGEALAWGCYATLRLEGCVTLPGASLGEALAAGRVGPFELARALAQDGASSTTAPVVSPDTWYRQALAQGDGRGGEALAARIVADGVMPSAAQRRAAMALYADAEAAFEAAADVPAQMRVLTPMARLAALDPRQRPEETARFVLRCRALRKEHGNDLPCPTPGELGVELEAHAASLEDWLRVRFWYENAVAEREAAGARGLARLLALGRTGDRDRRQALALLDDAAQRWVTFQAVDAAQTATQISDIWTHGWGIAADAGEASWWASQGARLGSVGAALRLASAFTLGAGTPRDLDRARDVVALYSEPAPLFEVAYYRSVGERLAAGDGVSADPQAADAWQRRAFELCQQLAGQGDADAQLELAGMYFSGAGVARDPRRAAQLYGRLLERAPVRAANMLAWIRATHPDGSLRDGAEALRLARAVVARAPRADYFDTLAAAQAEQGDFDAAHVTQRRALELLAAEADPALGGVDVAKRRADLHARLQTYQRRRPWRDPAQEEQRS
ncbi:MAG TPA: hypothetical protein VLA56_11100 [Pseudomonadales bacterium]|nr:hypothetical protein [Pseudomonadales bacterium]